MQTATCVRDRLTPTLVSDADALILSNSRFAASLMAPMFCSAARSLRRDSMRLLRGLLCFTGI